MPASVDPSGPPDPQLAAAWLAAIIASSEDAIISKDLHSVITSWNRGAEKIFGYTAAEMIGTSIMRLIPGDRQEEENLILGQIRRGETLQHFETRRLTKAGRLIDISVTASPIRDAAGRIAGVSKIARDISAAKTREREFARLSRLYAALSQVNQAIVMTPTQNELLQKVCQVLVGFGGFRLAWLGWHDPATQQLVPVAVWGDDSDYISSIRVYADERPEGRGPSGQAFRAGRPTICNDLSDDPAIHLWRAELERRGLRASAAFPVRCGNEVCAVLNVYADEPGFFQDKEIALLVEAAGDVSFALDNFRRNAERQQAEQQVQTEHDFSEAMLNSLPGVLYLYDQTGRFLRWNKNFETVTGYSAVEIAGMHPLDFFSGPDKQRVAARIQEVFAQKESGIEAGLLAKDGRVTPYYFTGVVTQFAGHTCLIGVGIDISARVRAESALRESEERFDAFMRATPTITWITDAAGRHLAMNPAWETAFGLDHRDWIGKTAADLVPPEAAARIRQSDLAVLEQDRAIEIPEDPGTLRGRPVYWDCIKFPFRNTAGERFIGGIAIDITARKLAEEARRASDARYRTLFDHAPDGILIADTRSVYLDANASMCRMLGYTHAELVGLHAADIIAPSEQPRIEPVIAEIKMHAAHHREWQFRRKDGSFFPVEVLATLMPDGNLLGMIRDITERKQAEAALRELNASLEHKVATRTEELSAALVRAEAADQIKSAFLATMSHELRTPLNSIIGFTGIILQGLAGPLNAEQTKQLGMVRGSARHLLELINDVLDISKIEAGQLEVRPEPFDLPALVERVTASVKLLADKKGLALAAVVAPELRGMVNDRRRLEQILLNLLNNALKFTERGQVTLTAERVADFRPSPAAAPVPAVCFRVTDTGIGIKREDQGKLFQPFHQIDSGLTRLHEGTGLGLVICARLAALLGGSISVASEWGQGSIFTVTLPLRSPGPS